MIPGTGISGLIHMIARRPLASAAVGVVCLGVMVPTSLPFIVTETLPPHVFTISPPKVTFEVTKVQQTQQIKTHPLHRVASKLKKAATRS
jgi:hypothetical protein